MLFGKIDYLNLLPFHVFLKRMPLNSSAKKAIEFQKGVPSILCKKLYNRKIDAAVISSIESRHRKYKKLDFGIVAKKNVKSVLVAKNTQSKLDPASMSSNMLAKILDIKGEVVIGDPALRRYLSEGEENFYDLGKIWRDKTGFPFVFAIFCYTKNGKIYKQAVTKFLRSNVKIPSYILSSYSTSRQISARDIQGYLKLITYKIGIKEKRGYKKFITEAKKLNFNPNF